MVFLILGEGCTGFILSWKTGKKSVLLLKLTDCSISGLRRKTGPVGGFLPEKLSTTYSASLNELLNLLGFQLLKFLLCSSQSLLSASPSFAQCCDPDCSCTLYLPNLMFFISVSFVTNINNLVATESHFWIRDMATWNLFFFFMSTNVYVYNSPGKQKKYYWVGKSYWMIKKEHINLVNCLYSSNRRENVRMQYPYRVAFTYRESDFLTKG